MDKTKRLNCCKNKKLGSNVTLREGKGGGGRTTVSAMIDEARENSRIGKPLLMERASSSHLNEKKRKQRRRGKNPGR